MRNVLRTSLVGVLLSACAVLAAPPVKLAPPPDVPVEVKGEPSSFIVIKVKGTKEIGVLQLTPGLSFVPPELLNDPRALVVMAARPGKYQLFVYGTNSEGALMEGVTVTVVVGTPGPDPGPEPPKPNPPDPGPMPQPGPTPVTTEFLWAVVVEETATRTVDTAKILNDVEGWKTITSAGHKYRVYDKDAQNGAAYAKLAAAKGVALPAVLYVDAVGKVYLIEKLPDSAAKVRTTLKTLTGK